LTPRRRHGRLAAFSLSLALALAGGVRAHAACLALPERHVSAPAAQALATAVESVLAAKGAKVAIVFRLDLPRVTTPRELLFSQGGLFVHVDDDAGPHDEIYALQQGRGGKTPCERSVLTQETPDAFFAWAVEPRASALIPTTEMQARLLAVLGSPAYAALHNPDYSLMANPFERRHQNGAGFLLRLVEAARLDTTDADRIDAAIRREFRPTEVKLNPLMRTLGGTVNGRMALDDQHGAIQTAAFPSLAGYMAAKGLLAEPPLELAPPR